MEKKMLAILLGVMLNIPSMVVRGADLFVSNCETDAFISSNNEMTLEELEEFDDGMEICDGDLPEVEKNILDNDNACDSVSINKSIIKKGNLTQDITWKLYINGLLEISGKGDMPDFSPMNEAPWYSYIEATGIVTEVRISEGVTNIGSYAFYTHYSDYKNVKEINIPDTVKKIGACAFYGWDGLKSIKLSNKLIKIDSKALGYTALEEITLPDTLQVISNDAFWQGKLKRVKGYVNSYANTYAKNNFYEFISLGNDIAPDLIIGGKASKNIVWKLYTNGLLEISGKGDMPDFSPMNEAPWYSYIETTGIVTEVRISEGVTNIGSYAFYTHYSDYKNVKEINIPDTVKKIGVCAFYGWDGLKSIKLSNKLIRIDSKALGYTALEEITLPDTLQVISNDAFWQGKLKRVKGYSDSKAEFYAKEQGYEFCLIESNISETSSKLDISNSKISGIQGTYEYTGKPIKPIPKVILNNTQLIANKDYDISYRNNKKVGIAVITIQGKGKFNGSQIIEFRITTMKNNIDKAAVSFANIFAKQAKSASPTTATSAKRQLEKLGNQVTVTGYKGELPTQVWEAFATAVLNAIGDSNIDKYETNQNKLVNQIYNQIKGGLKSNSKKIVLRNGSKKITYNVDYTIFAQPFGGIGAQVSWAEVKWKDTKNKSYSVYIVANSNNENMKKALASYCAVLAQLNKGVWKEFLTKYITDGWKLAGLNSVKTLDDKTVSKFFDHSEKLILTICGDKNAKKAFVNDAGNTLKEKLLKMSKTQFRDFIKNNIPNGDKIITAADQYKKLVSKYNDYKKKFDKWNKTRKNSDLTKYEKAYQECQALLEVLNDSLSKVS